MNETQRAYDQAQNVGLIRIREATNQMKTNDALAGYATNEAFADEFAKYMKFGRRCTSANLDKCFAPKFKLPDNTEIDVTTLTTGDKLGHATYTAPTVGLGLVNGTNMILAFDPACPRIDPYNNTTDTTACLAVIYDINGGGKPNQVGKDIALLNVSFGTGCTGPTIGGLCINGSDTTYTPISEAPYMSNDNFWAGARDACIAQGMRLPTQSDLSIIYANRGTIAGLNTSGAAYWSSTGAPMAWIQFFDTGGSQMQAMANLSASLRCVK